MADLIIFTGAAGFVAMHAAEWQFERVEAVAALGVDVFNANYVPALKAARASRLEGCDGFTIIRMDIAEREATETLVKSSGARRVIHMAAQAGVRYLIEKPFAYEHNNFAGQISVSEACRHTDVEHLAYALPCSVYGDRHLNGEGFGKTNSTERLVSLYVATKRTCETLSQSYAGLYRVPQSGPGFFTVYGPWGRPEEA